MKKHLTDAAVKSFRAPKEGQIEIFDLGYPGLALRVGKGGAKTFEQFYRQDGKLKRDTLGRWPAISLAEARNRWRQTREAIQKGERPSYGSSTAPLFEFVAEEWLRKDQASNKKQTLYLATRTVEADLIPAWRGKPIDTITKRDVIDLLDGIEARSPSSALRVRSLVSRLFRWCLERDILKADPTAALPRAVNLKARERVMTDAELARVWHAATGTYGSIVRLLMLTGARRQEIAKLRWSEIDGDTIKLAGERTKNGEPRFIPLSAPARAIIDSMPRVSEYVFPIATSSILKARLVKASGVNGWTLHDFRRTVATGMQKLGVTLQSVECVLGHTAGSRGGVVGIYQRHDYADEKRAALTKWADQVANLTA